MTLRDARLPAVPGKVHAMIGMRRAGKTVFLQQFQAEQRAKVPPERAIYLSFDDDRLAGMGVVLFPFVPRTFPATAESTNGSEW